jgi:hypothetical protein
MIGPQAPASACAGTCRHPLSPAGSVPLARPTASGMACAPFAGEVFALSPMRAAGLLHPAASQAPGHAHEALTNDPANRDDDRHHDHGHRHLRQAMPVRDHHQRQRRSGPPKVQARDHGLLTHPPGPKGSRTRTGRAHPSEAGPLRGRVALARATVAGIASRQAHTTPGRIRAGQRSRRVPRRRRHARCSCDTNGVTETPARA